MPFHYSIDAFLHIYNGKVETAVRSVALTPKAYLATQINERVNVKGIFFIYLKVTQNSERKNCQFNDLVRWNLRLIVL